jgi:hypothetical protein
MLQEYFQLSEYAQYRLIKKSVKTEKNLSSKKSLLKLIQQWY